MDGRPDALLMNSTAAAMISMVAAFSGQLRSTTDSFGVMQDSFRASRSWTSVRRPDSPRSSSATRRQDQRGPDLHGIRHLSSGTYAISFQGQTTAPIAYDATAANVVTASTYCPTSTRAT